MVEVFKTNVDRPLLAKLLVGTINGELPGHRANFDLEDCDRILRVVCTAGDVQSGRIIELLAGFGCRAEILEDEVPEAPGAFNRRFRCMAGHLVVAQ
ncbi:hypothetical protein ACFOTA_07715 [Chitinophaga sp. GCM10012297]|uniref:Uncharacterized protein n=1 Tax=Chitinophaga chungangae TaxID=2821488 RepID=A0ABS3YBP4_9BACT|nr:hypothetical protein [Chitinophaga chungangae]MBO9152089.1 hypothetical protein [Chitinophaga chungangae]